LRRELFAVGRALLSQAADARRQARISGTAVNSETALNATNADLRRKNAALAAELAAQAEQLNTAHAGQIAELAAVAGAEKANVLAQLNAARDEALALSVKLESAHLALELMEEKFQELEREHNELTSETLPNLQKDKEDLVALVGEEFTRAETFSADVSRKLRRSSYAIIAAAAACAVAVLMPLFAMNAWETKSRELKNTYAEKVELVETQLAVAQRERAAAQEQSHGLQTALAQTGEERQSWRAKAAELQTLLRQAREETARVKAASIARDAEFARLQTTTQTQAAELEQLRAANSRTVNATYSPAPADGHYNEVSGIDEWMRAAKAPKPASDAFAALPADADETIDDDAAAFPSKNGAMIELKTVTVRRGEGLSQVLWRACGRSTPKLVAQVARYNRLGNDSRGTPRLRVGQEIKVPAPCPARQCCRNEKAEEWF
jgi:hypothetical protein